MENTQIPGHPIIAAVLTFVCLLNGTYAAIINDVELSVRIGAGGIAMISGMFAMRYYYYAAEEKRRILKNKSDNP